MERHVRLMGFLLMCFVLLGLNVIATISGLYTSMQESQVEPVRLIYTETMSGGIG